MITFSFADHLILLLYFALILSIGFVAGRKQGKADFLLAGRTLTLPIFVMTLVSSWYGGILGVGEFSYRYGISNWVVQGLPYYIFALVFAWLLAERIRATNLVTIPDRLHQVYDRKTALLGAFLTFLLTTPAPYILMVGILLQVTTGWPLFWCIVLGTAATTVYLFTGGFRADVYTDVAEFVVMFLGFIVAIVVAAFTLGGTEYLGANLPPLHLTWHGGNSWQFILAWFLIALWTLVDPTFHQRCYAAKDGKTAKRGILLSVPMWFLFDALTATTGLYARAVLTDLDNPVMAYPAFAEAVLPPVAKGLFVAGMLATVMSTLNTMSFISATTLGRDLYCRMRSMVEGNVTRATRYGLVITGALSIALCLVIPSVIDLWYIVGTSIIPGLLTPVVISYFPALRVSPTFAFSSMLSGWSTATLWLGLGWSGQGMGAGEYALGIEPMFPGLFASFAVWGTGMLLRNSKQARKAK